jgi:hypothetical protein
VFLYGESISLGKGVFDDYVHILGGGSTATALLTHYGANAVLTGPGSLHDTLSASSAWHAVLDDPMGATLFVDPQLAARVTAPARC